MLTALFGIDDGSLNLAVNLLILVLVVVWLALVYWTYADARRRIGDPVLVATATAASLFPFIGTVVYTILRPPEYLEDKQERELETRAAELRLRRLTETSCPRCEHPIELSWLRCPECQHRLKDPCRDCGRPVDPRWAICPHCEAPVAPPRAASRRAAPRRAKGARARGQRAGRPQKAPPAQKAAPQKAPQKAAPERAPQKAAPERAPQKAAPERAPQKAAPARRSASERRSDQKPPPKRRTAAPPAPARSSNDGEREQGRGPAEGQPRKKPRSTTARRDA